MPAFEQAFAVVVGEEGGYSDDPADPGGATKFGISRRAYPGLDIAALTLADAQAIYRRDYWDRVRADALPPALALLVFDAAVNNGVARAAEWLQAACGVAEDGEIGPQTLAAAARGPVADVCAEFQARRLLFMVALPTWRDFGAGWARRLCALPYRAAALTQD